MPALAVTSSSCGMGRFLHWMDFALGGGAVPWATPWPLLLPAKAKEHMRARLECAKERKQVPMIFI